MMFRSWRLARVNTVRTCAQFFKTGAPPRAAGETGPILRPGTSLHDGAPAGCGSIGNTKGSGVLYLRRG